MVAADRFQRPMRRSACAHVVLGMNLEEIDAFSALENVGGMVVFEPGADGAGADQVIAAD